MLMDSVHQELGKSGDGFSLLHDEWTPNKIAGDWEHWGSF